MTDDDLLGRIFNSKEFSYNNLFRKHQMLDECFFLGKRVRWSFAITTSSWAKRSNLNFLSKILIWKNDSRLVFHTHLAEEKCLWMVNIDDLKMIIKNDGWDGRCGMDREPRTRTGCRRSSRICCRSKIPNILNDFPLLQTIISRCWMLLARDIFCNLIRGILSISSVIIQKRAITCIPKVSHISSAISCRKCTIQRKYAKAFHV